MIDQFEDENAIISIVSDSYDIYNAVDYIYGTVLKNKIDGLAQKHARLVVRPDSGEPTEIVPEVVQHLMDKFGYTTTSKGYKLLPDHVRVLQGDGIDHESLPRILKALKDAGLATANVVFGMGGGLLQKVDRDTLKFAMKCSASYRDGVWHDVFKDPITSPGKTSKKGRLAVIEEDGQIRTIREDELGTRQNIMVDVFENGIIKTEYNLDEIRDRAKV